MEGDIGDDKVQRLESGRLRKVEAQSLEWRKPRKGEARLSEGSSIIMWSLTSSGIMLRVLLKKMTTASLEIQPLSNEGEGPRTSVKDFN